MVQSKVEASQNILTRLTAPMRDAFYATGFWADATLYTIARGHAAANPAKVVVRDSHCMLSYGDLLGLSDVIAADLHRHGLRPGDRVAAWLSSRAETGAFLLACSRNGYVFCPSLHRNHTTDEIVALLQHVHVSGLVAEEGYGRAAAPDAAAGDDIVARAAGLDTMRRVYRLPAPGPRDAASIGDTLGLGPTPDIAPSASADDIVYLAFTSGTTGDPKGVMHSNNTLLANARALAADWNFGPDSVIYTLSPLIHNLGFGALVLTLLVGGEIVLHDLGRGASLLQRLRETRVTFLFGVPTHAADLLNEIEAAGRADLDALKGFRISGAAAPPTVVEKLLRYGIVPQSGYGMTEACSHNYTLPNDDPATIVGTSGRACPGYEIAVFSIDNPDARLPVGEVGQIGGRGASLMLGYFDDQRATETAFNRDGWFMTGDLGRLDAAGYLQITGRLKDVIIRGGHNIHPARIEQLTMRYPGVERAAAIPVKDERLGEKVCIVVMAKDGAVIDPDKLLAHLNGEGLSTFDMPEYFLAVPEIPLSANGKILKRALISAVAEGRFKPVPVRWQGRRE
jgi:acyl-CoA synthetase